jgi:hypothetical protein
LLLLLLLPLLLLVNQQAGASLWGAGDLVHDLKATQEGVQI